MDELQLVQLDNNDRASALSKLGYTIDDNGYVLDSEEKPVICKYSEEKVHINYAALLPGSLLIINATPETMAQYFLEYC